MTENEAIELLRSMQNPKQDYADVVCAPAFCTGFRFVYPEPEDYAIEEAIKALKEVQQYREIGTVEECREAVDKQKQKKPKIHKDRFSNTYNCPKCSYVLIHRDETGWFCGQHYKFCPGCGQAIQWKESEEE